MTSEGRGSDEARHAQDVRRVFDTIPTLAWSAGSDGSADFFNRRWLDYTGLSVEQACGWGWAVAVHPDDLKGLSDYWRSVLASREPGEIEARLRRFDGVYRWFLFRATPSFGNDGAIVKWFGTNTDIEDRKRAEEALRATERNLRLIFDTIPGFIWTMTATGEVELANQQLLEYFGKTVEELKECALFVHPDDRARVVAYWSSTIEAGQSYDIEHRLRRADGVYRWFHARGLPLRDNEGHIVRWYNLLTDIDERKRAQDALRASELTLRLIVDTIPGFVCTLSAEGEVELLNRQLVEYFGKTTEELKDWDASDAVHPEDLPRVIDAWRRSVETGQPYDLELRQRRADGVYRWFQSRALPARDLEGRITSWYMLLTDIDDRKRAEDALRSNEQSLRLIFDSIPGFISTHSAAGEIEVINRQTLEYFGKTAEELKKWATSDDVHPDDVPRMIDAWKRAVETGQPVEVEHRSRGADGVYRWFLLRGRPQRDDEGRVVRWYNLVTDVDDRKRAEGELERAFNEKAKSEAELRTIIDAIPQLIIAIGAAGQFLDANQAFLEYTGLTKEEAKSQDFRDVFHSEDSERLRDVRSAAIARGVPFEYERRVRRRDGQYRWVLVQYNPLRDERGDVIRWYATGTDIDDRKQAEDRTRQENVALREQIDQVFMFEEIVGSSPALKTVLSSIVKVAPTDSTVLITGETGTGKELIARAIHKASPRASQAFISVNCAAIPQSLIASELFGHEKGAFTGAMQRRQGRFELAHSGTIFLDEIGELPAETQIALLRVLQERQFERVGGSRAISTDVRIIAATNRDLSAAIASGTFRADLFYRLNVFPIDVPPLRQRTADIPMLVAYFVKRYAVKARKQISKIDKKTLELCVSYHWPGNIRELQNIVERSVILCSGDTFSVEPAWLSRQSASRPESGALANTLQGYEREIIEKALADSNGKVAGPHGAAAKLGIPRTTLDARIRQLNIKRSTIR
jgi:formate hydrogenlyase transcriptional activator